jgi:predicted DNA binding CopG/RHH family protein
MTYFSHEKDDRSFEVRSTSELLIGVKYKVSTTEL